MRTVFGISLDQLNEQTDVQRTLCWLCCPMQRARSARSVLGGEASSFQLPARYHFQKLLGSGSYGVVASFRDATDGRDVAIKRMRKVFDNFLMLRRTLREIKLMRHFRHPNLLQLHDVLLVESGGELYISMELMDCDLDRLVRGRGVPLEESLCRSYCSQVLLGLLHLHCAHVIHRDLKPANIFIRLKAHEAKIGDLGLSRGIAVDGQTGEAIHPIEEQLTEYVVTRWYRAPEVLLARSKYGPKVDVWSVGCILYEMWTAKALFPGKNSLDQLSKVVGIMGMPSLEEQWWVPEESRPLLLRCSPQSRSVKGLSKMLGHLDGDGATMLRGLLAFDPSRRLSVEAALQHPYLEGCSSTAQVERAKVVEAADVTYDLQYDGISKGGEANALSKLARMLRQEAASPRARRSLSRERLSRRSARRALSTERDERESINPALTVEAAKADDDDVVKLTSQRSTEKRPKPSKSYQALHKQKQEHQELQDGAVITADVLDLPLDTDATPEVTATSGETERLLLKRSSLPAAAIPSASHGLRSRAAWKKALVAAQHARAAQDAILNGQGSSESSAFKSKAETSNEVSRRGSALKVNPTASTMSEAGPRRVEEDEAEISHQLSKLQALQEEQERKLQRFLGDVQAPAVAPSRSAGGCSSQVSGTGDRMDRSNRRSSAPELTERAGSRAGRGARGALASKLEMARDARDAARSAGVRGFDRERTREERENDGSISAREAPSSPSGSLRAAASLASDRAGLDAAGMPRPSLFDQLLESRDLPSSRPSPPGPATTTGPSPQSRPSPRRKGQQPQQSHSATPRRASRRADPSDGSSSRRPALPGDVRSVSPKPARRRDMLRGTQSSQNKVTARSKSPNAQGLRQPLGSESQQSISGLQKELPNTSCTTRQNPFDAAKLARPGVSEPTEQGPAKVSRPVEPEIIVALPEVPAELPDAGYDSPDSPLHRSTVEGPRNMLKVEQTVLFRGLRDGDDERLGYLLWLSPRSPKTFFGDTVFLGHLDLKTILN
ncbi:unnamed protein product [Durusdinium trenchii]|uniref:Protein kinase domain-containing protein n=1 Tax=Durusdinium trenchii TaxID=1381693 RepID=A0ABP0PC20_9DINO